MDIIERRDKLGFENLLGLEPDLNIADCDGWTALMYAVVNATTATDVFIEDLVSSGADLCIKNKVSRLYAILIRRKFISHLFKSNRN